MNPWSAITHTGILSPVVLAVGLMVNVIQTINKS
jgi:hypothetical protein